jgi:ribonuclease BN (tRNA processing enzyme)
VVGSGTLVPDANRGAPAHWVEIGRSRLLMDCGAGTLRTMARLGLPWGTISHLLFTHFHTDHVGELASLLFALRHGLEHPRKSPIQLLGPVGLLDHMEALSRAHGSFILEPGFPLTVHEISRGGGWEEPLGDFRIETMGTRHTANSIAVRVETRDGCLGYTGDTGPDRALGLFFRGCRILLAECSNPGGEEGDNHLTPQGLAVLASEAVPEVLVSVHCYPALDPSMVPYLIAEAGYEGRVLTGWDGLALDLTDGTVEVLDVRHQIPLEGNRSGTGPPGL